MVENEQSTEKKGTDGDILSALKSGTETLQEENAENES